MDITTEGRQSTARANLFVKVFRGFNWKLIDQTYPSSSPLYKECIKLLDEAIIVNKIKYEVVLNSQIIIEKDSPIMAIISNLGT